MNLKDNLFGLILFTFIALTTSASAVSTTCGFVNVDYNDQVSLTVGQTGAFTVTAFNQGSSVQRVTANAQCNPLQVDCSFTGISENTLLAPNEQKVFSLQVTPKVAGAFAIPGTFQAGPSSPTCTANLQFNLATTPQDSMQLPPITAWIDPTESQNARPGDQVQFTIGVKNNLAKKIFTNIASQGANPFQSSTTLTASNIALEASETKYVTVTVRLPPGTPGGTYSWIYKLDSRNCCGYSTELPISVTVEAPILDLQLLGAPVQDECIEVNSTTATAIPLVLENNGEVTGPFDLSIQGTNTVTGISRVTEPRFTLLSGERKPFEIRISPDQRTPIDTYHYKLRATYQGFIFLDNSYCFTVKGISNVNVTAPRNLVIERNRLSVVEINVTNTGTTTDEYALTIAPEATLVTNIEPSSLRLLPGKSQTVALQFTTIPTTSLGPRSVTLRVDALNYSKNIQLNATVYATGRTGESLLKITSERELNAPRGGTKKFNVTVENLGTELLRDVELTLDGIDPTWYSAEPQTIFAGASETFEVTLAVPQNAVQQQYESNLTATSGYEFVFSPFTITLSNTLFNFVIDEIVENKNANGDTTSVDLIMTLTNTGLTTATQVTPLINDLNYIYQQNPAELTLQPGQSAQIRVHLSPAAKDVENKTIALQFTAQEGVSGSQQVTLPTLKVSENNFMLKIAAILVLLIAIVAVLAKTQKR